MRQEPPDFSLVLGGPLYQLWRRTHLSGDALEMLRRRAVVLALLAWVPLLMLSVVEGHAWGGNVKLPLVPFTMPTVLQLAITTLLPVGPLLLTMIPLEELLERMLKILF